MTETSAPNPDEKVARCAQCDSEFTDAQLNEASAAGKNGCPTCGTTSLPMKPSNDVTIKINTHELRILTIWASNYAERPDMPAHSRKTLQCIIQRLQAQLPHVHFTLASEVRELQNLGHNAELIKGDGTVVVPKKEPPS